ncbi:MAG TPA: metal-dependent hydrolase [Blastocatellia bacterium]|nr:metal-dependent hydrolase [Blastocatellia bacterium]
MENLAHTLLGLGLAKAGLERATPLATTALVISSNLPDIDVVVRLRGITPYLEHHRGLTHSLVGLIVLAAVLAFLLAYLDRKFRLRRDPFRRPVRPARLFAVSLLGGLGHTFMDFTNTYGVRPLLPFSSRWYYGDLAFVVDPWIWLILGSGVVWLTTSAAAARPNSRIALRAIFWLVVGVLASLPVALAFRTADETQMTIPTTLRVIWFTGLAVIVVGAVLGWGRAGARLARYSLLILVLYYGGLWVAHQTAKERADQDLPAETARGLAAWPTPANPLAWQVVAGGNEFFYTRHLVLGGATYDWREMAAADPALVQELRQWEEARKFLDFVRFTTVREESRDDERRVLFRDIRFPLQMSVVFDRDRAVRSVDVRWF